MDRQQYEQLFAAVRNGDLDTIKNLVQQGISLAVRYTDYGFSPLLLAALDGQTPILSFLVERGLSVNDCTNRGTTALMLAAGHGHTETLQWLLEHGADINARNESGENVLSYALEIFEGSESNLSAIVQIILSHPIDLEAKENSNNYTPLMIAVRQGYFQAVKLLVEAGADVNAVAPSQAINQSSLTAEEQIKQLEEDGDYQSLALAQTIKETGKPLKLMTIIPAATPLSLTDNSEIRAYLLAHGAKNPPN